MEVQKLKITEQDRKLVSGFMGEEYPLEIDFNWLMPVWIKFREIKPKFGEPMQRGIYHYKEIIGTAITSGNIKQAREYLAKGIEFYNQNSKL